MYTLKAVKQYFASRKKIRVFERLAKSLDLNIIENYWGNLTRAVYQNGRNTNELKKFIVEQSKELNQRNH